MSENCIYFILSLVGFFFVSFIVFVASHMIIWHKLKKIYGNELIVIFDIPRFKELNSIEYIHGLTPKGFFKLETMIWKNDFKLKHISKKTISIAYFSLFLFYPLILCLPLSMFLCSMLT